MAHYIAKNIVGAELTDRCEIQISYNRRSCSRICLC
ncbi:hypothetical protein RPM_06625 [Rickettsia rickettsii str. Hauke]|nr:hypothetical protein RPM_06625 [Rickettsia rickettsii str. Hauke]